MRILFALPGLHRVDRGAEVAFVSVARELARGGDQVTLIGSGTARPDEPYRFLHVGSVRRERFEDFPKLPTLRVETSYEEASFAPGLLANYRPHDFDVTITCSYPFTNWILRRPAWGRRPAHIFVTQNGDWAAFANTSEFRLFGCEGLVCTNPDYYERNSNRWNCSLIPNGVSVERFSETTEDRARFGLPAGKKMVLMVSALIDSKRVMDGIRSVGTMSDVHLAVAGDGPLRHEVDALAHDLLPGRFTRLTVSPTEMPTLYRSADAFLHLSRDESFGNVYLEALAAGLPIIAHDTPRVRWIVGDDQFLVDTYDGARLVDALKAALASSTQNAGASRARAATFAWDSVAARYRNFLEDVVTGYGHAVTRS